MRTSIAKAYVSTMRRDKDRPDLTPERLCVVALSQIYGVADPIRFYQEHRYAYGEFHRFIDGTIAPTPCDAQAELSMLSANAPHISLYLSTYRSPDLIASLTRNEQGLYALAHHRIRAFAGLPPRDGVFMYWADTTPPPDHAASMTPQFERVVRGGRAALRMLSEVKNVSSIRRQLTACVKLEQMLSLRASNLAHVYHHKGPGRATFAYDGDYNFEPVSTRPNARIGDKFRVRIYGDLPPIEALGKQPRYFGTQIKDATHADLPVRHRLLLRKLLLSMAIPVVGVLRDNGADMYAMHWDGEDYDPAYLSTVKLRLDSVPWIKLPTKDYQAQANVELLQQFKDALLADVGPHTPTLMQVLREFVDDSGVVGLLGEQGILCTPSEAKHIQSLEKLPG